MCHVICIGSGVAALGPQLCSLGVGQPISTILVPPRAGFTGLGVLSGVSRRPRYHKFIPSACSAVRRSTHTHTRAHAHTVARTHARHTHTRAHGTHTRARAHTHTHIRTHTQSHGYTHARTHHQLIEYKPAAGGDCPGDQTDSAHVLMNLLWLPLNSPSACRQR